MSTFTHTTAKIAVWNIANNFNDLGDDRLARIVDGLAILDAEVVTLVEVKPFDYLDRILAGLAAKGCVYEFKMLPQASDLNIGVIYKQGIQAENPAFIDGSDLGLARHRKAFHLKMRVGRFDFMLIGVHLKSGRADPDQRVRDRQCAVIGEFITGVLDDNPRQDILLMGDFNMIPGQDVSNFHFLGGADMMDFLSSWDLQDRYSHILEAGRANLLDGFAISRNRNKEYIKGSLRLFQMHWTMDMGRARFREQVSDHLPFVASFRIDRDRD